jgi:hypothetical protein
MLPTSYRGAATINGEALAAELHLDAENITLRLEDEQEVLRWPITRTDVTAIRSGDYRLRMGEEAFEFTPVVDDGLGDEIALRRRFAQNESAIPAVDVGEAPQPAPPLTIADRVTEAGRTSARRPGVLEGKDLGLRTALVVLGILALAVVSVAVWSGALQDRPATVVVGADATSPTTAAPDTTVAAPTTVPAPTTTAPEAPATTLPPATTTTLTPPTVAPATVTTSTTIPPPTSVFEMTPEQLTAGWDRIALGIDRALGAGSVATSANPLFRSAPVTTSRSRARSPMVGSVSSDSSEIPAVPTSKTAGFSPPSASLWRWSNPPFLPRDAVSSSKTWDSTSRILIVSELDDSFSYSGKDWVLRWDGEYVVFEVAPEGTLTAEEADS